MAKTRTKLVPATTENITNDVLNRLRADGHACRRINTAGIWDEVGGFYRKVKKTETGTSDVIACLKGKMGFGLFAGIEIKKGKDTQRNSQSKFEAEVRAAGGLYILIKVQSDFIKWYDYLKTTEII